MRPVLLLLLLLHLLAPSKAQPIAPALLQKAWPAAWIAVPGESPTGYGVYLFRKGLVLAAKPASFVVHVSADNRYKLFVNGKLASLGPARGDLTHWKFETVDLAPYLQAGPNVVAAQVWNEGERRGEPQISLRTGFILQGNTAAEYALNTNASWRCLRDAGYAPLPVQLKSYYVAGPGELVTPQAALQGWETTNYAETTWQNAQALFTGTPKNMLASGGSPHGWMLIPSALPPMELTPQRLSRVRLAEGVRVPGGFPARPAAFTVPANTVATLLLDQGFLTNAYPTLLFSGGQEATISLRYAESLFSRFPAKGNRDEVAGKHFIGRADSLRPIGAAGQAFTSLNWRTYRYVQLRITTKAQPLVVNDFYGTFTGYPFRRVAKLEADNAELGRMLDVGWRTARLCAFETYMDCPYYEQLQYIGDARIQALVSLYNAGDDRLLRSALTQMDESRQPEGITLSRHPSATPQYIPTFSLWYIGMLHDYWQYGRDAQFVEAKLPGTRQILAYFRRYQQPDGSLHQVPNWLFTDWVKARDWVVGVAPQGADGSSAALDLQLLWAYQLAADMEATLGMPAYAAQYTQYAKELKNTIQAKYWVPGRQLLADRPEQDVFSQHTNALAILTGVVASGDAPRLGRQLLADTTLAQASIYFKYYLHQALVKAGLGNDYLSWLGKWRENLTLGLTTWGETSAVSTTRSDCHAWGASPNIEFFRTVLGIDSDAPGFARVKIEPHLGTLRKAAGEIPHPAGKVAVSYVQQGSRWQITISLPPATPGFLRWQGKRYELQGGMNALHI